ncbi:MAG TPA: hypothetical protein VE818_08160 [Nitrososphaeraceae archaeon]|nr:hypothetical protein [Nitrososphaeraceae archaeon]
MLGTSISALEFFSHYGNVENINSQFLVAYNKNATLVSVGASIDLIGENFFGSIAQKYINSDDVLNNLTRRRLTGNSSYAVYGYGTAGRLTTGYPFMLITSLNISSANNTYQRNICSRWRGTFYTNDKDVFLAGWCYYCCDSSSNSLTHEVESTFT